METKIIQCIRCLAADAVQKANSGHPGAPMGMAPIATLLWGETMHFDAKDPKWHNRDRFVLSNGHGSMLIYTMLHLCGYQLTLDDIKNFRQAKYPNVAGHPERLHTPGVEVTTGPLGQGVSNAVGMAIAEANLAARFNKPDLKIVDHKTWAFCGDGCLMEGVACESLSLAGHLGLEKLIVVYDDNKISIDGSTDLAFTEQTSHKYEALGWRTIIVKDGDTDLASMRSALKTAQEPCGKPTMILLKTTIGKDAKAEGTHKVHGSPLGPEDIVHLKKLYGRDPEKHFVIEQEVYDHFHKAAARGTEAHNAWKELLKAYESKYPEDAAKYNACWSPNFDKLESIMPKNEKAIATRKASENALAQIFKSIEGVVGGSADLTGSNLTRPGNEIIDFQKESPHGRYIRFGVREHGMCAVLNGIDAHGGLIGFGGTFLNFVSYAMGAVRLAALSHHGVIYVATHDSIGLGEDGPTHQPIETLAALRSMPNMLVLRPADQTETSAAWLCAMKNRTGPTTLCLSRQNATPLAGSTFEGVYKGAYPVHKVDNADVIIVSSGTEVAMCVDAAKKLGNATVVSMPSWELFGQQSAEYRETVFPRGTPVLSVEPYCSFGWERFSHAHVGINGFGLSGLAEEVYEHFGLTSENVANKAKALAARFAKGTAPVLGHVEL